MRKAIVIMGFLSLIGFGPVSAAQDKAGQDRAEQGTHPATMKVSGMHCGACASKVESEARKLEGVKTVKASQPKGVAEITYDPAKTTPEAIAKFINEKTAFKAEAESKKPTPRQ